MGVDRTRRTALAVGLASAGGMLLAGCSGPPNRADAGSPASTTPPDEDILARDRVASRCRQLLASAHGGPATLSGLLRRVVADHERHLDALGAGRPGRTGVRTGAAELAAGEWTGAREALAELLPLGPGMAALLARIAAARAVHADLIAGRAGLPARAAQLVPAAGPAAATPTGSADRSPADQSRIDVAAQGRLLAGEHAAVFAYGVVAARTDDPLARRFWAAHVAGRDALERSILAADGTPPAAAAGYDIGPLPADRAAARALAVRVEQRLAVLAGAEVAATDGPTRTSMAQQLVAAGRREAAWRRLPRAFPGQP